VAVLISGRGSNLRSLVAAGLPVCAVISNRPDAAGIAFAREAGIATAIIDHAAFATRSAFDEALAAAIEAHDPELVVLAGFMRVLGRSFVERFAGRLVNIHPSLLPAFPGLHTHERALAAGVKVHGATVHFVTAELDSGPILAQVTVPVLPGDDAATLAARVLAEEHVILPRVVRWVLDRRHRLIDGVVTVDGESQWLSGTICA